MDTSYTIKRIVIDAGHGGKDSGCIGVSKTQEKDITLKIALSLGAKIKSKFPHIKVIYTRQEDVFIPLDERANIANRNRADLFISIHCNYIPNYPEYHGSETYVLGLERSKANLAVAKRENQSILMEDNYSARYAANIWDSPEGNILLTAWQSSYLTRSMHIAEKVETELSNTAERKSHGVKQAGFLVLRQTTMPSILVETGFLSNEDEELYLNSKEGQEKESSALFNAFCQYKNEVENKEKEVENNRIRKQL
jgi:N-acetylmuramoyl-L-alanine amidase